MLGKKDIDAMSDKQKFESIVYIKSYDVRPTKNGGKFINGLLEAKGTVDFKVWSGKLFDEMEKYDYQGMACHVVGEVNEYNGNKGLILSEVRALEEGTYDESDFFEDKYDIPAYWSALCSIVKKNCSDEAWSIFEDVMGDVSDRFKVEFAARGHHDAFKGGLLAHTYKNLYCLSKTIKLYQPLCKFLDKDLLYVGMAFHDIGKVREYTNGAIMGNGLLVSHHTFGVEIVSKHKEKIITMKSEEFYYRLLAIIEQHHGEFEETPRTIEAYIIHLYDNLESRLQSMNETIEKGLGTVSIDGFKLN